MLAVGVVTLGAVAFSSFAHLLRTALGTVGSSLLLVTLVLQLAAAGGTYPAVILPGFFAAIHPYLPMSYLIDAFRVVISGGLAAHLARDAGILAALAAVALGLTVLTVARRQWLSVKDLHPPLVAPLFGVSRRASGAAARRESRGRPPSRDPDSGSAGLRESGFSACRADATG